MAHQADRTFRVYFAYVPKIDKKKFVVAVTPCGQQWYCFLINSYIADFLRQPAPGVCFFRVPRAEHQFLHHDSYLTTDRAFPLFMSSLDCHRGNLSPSCQQQLYDATRACRELLVKTKKLVVGHLDARRTSEEDLPF